MAAADAAQPVSNCAKPSIPGYIYFLVDPASQEVRYIGKTQKTVADRVARHLAAAKKPKNHLTYWIASLVDGPVVQQVAQFNTSAELDAAEVAWITYGRAARWPLVNLSSGGTGGPIRLGMKNTPEHIAAALAGRRLAPLTPEHRKNISDAKLKNAQELERFASLAAVGGAAARAVVSVPRSCVLCRQSFLSRKSWQAHYANAHQDVIKARRAQSGKKAAEARWRNYYASKEN